MINHIDVSTVLRRTVCDLYSNLVTRPTGAAVRSGIERQLAEIPGRTLTVIDFSNVGLLDFSCADEIVAKLLLRHCSEAAGMAADEPFVRHDGYFVFRGVSESHLDAIEAVLERHGLALVLEEDGGARLVGTIDECARRVWEALARRGTSTAEELATAAGCDAAAAREALALLCRRRLAMPLDDGAVAIVCEAR